MVGEWLTFALPPTGPGVDVNAMRVIAEVTPELPSAVVMETSFVVPPAVPHDTPAAHLSSLYIEEFDVGHSCSEDSQCRSRLS